MTLFELLVFLAVLLCGALIGAGVATLVGLMRGIITSDAIAYGSLLGSVTTLLAVLISAWWFGRMDSVHPPCRCGKSDWEDFSLGRAENVKNVWCCVCGKQYSWPEWRLWYELDDRGDLLLFMKRDVLGRWRSAAH